MAYGIPGAVQTLPQIEEGFVHTHRMRTVMKFAAIVSASLLAGSLGAFAPAAQAQGAPAQGGPPPSQPAMAAGQGSIPMDTPTTIGGAQAVCTGIGEQAQNPQWLAYPLRIEFSNGGAQYLSGAHVELTTAAGHPVAGLDCNGPWVLFRVPPGTYKVTATLMSQPGGTSSATVTAPSSGQKRVVLDFKVGPNQ